MTEGDKKIVKLEAWLMGVSIAIDEDATPPTWREQCLFWLKALVILGPAGVYRQYQWGREVKRQGTKIYFKDIKKR